MIPWKARAIAWFWRTRRWFSLNTNLLLTILTGCAVLLMALSSLIPPLLYWAAVGTLAAALLPQLISLFWARHRRFYELELSKLYGLRHLSHLVDQFRVEAETLPGEALDRRADGVLASALKCIATTLFPRKSVSLTFLSLLAQELRLGAWYPDDLDVDMNFCVLLSDPGDRAYAKEAALSGRTIYLPYVRQNWSFRLATPSQPGGPIRYELAAHGLWKPTSRRNFRSLLIVPCLIASGQREWEPYGVLNVESSKRDAFTDSDIFCVCIAANRIAQCQAIYAAKKRRRAED